MNTVNDRKAMTNMRFWCWTTEYNFPNGVSGKADTMMPVDHDDDFPEYDGPEHAINISRRYQDVNKWVYHRSSR